MNEPVPRTLAAVLRVMNGPGATKHGDEWMTRPDHIDGNAEARHLLRANDELVSDYDVETGELHEIHALCRRIFRLERMLIEQEAKGGD